MTTKEDGVIRTFFSRVGHWEMPLKKRRTGAALLLVMFEHCLFNSLLIECLVGEVALDKFCVELYKFSVNYIMKLFFFWKTENLLFSVFGLFKWFEISDKVVSKAFCSVKLLFSYYSIV